VGKTIDEFEPSWIRQALFRLVALKILVLALAFDAGGLQAFDYPKSLLSRATEWVLAGLIVLALLRFGLGILPRTRLHFAVAAYVLAVLVSAAASENKYVSLFGEQDSYQGLTQLGDMVVLYLSAAIAYRRAADFRLVALAIGVTAGIVSVYAVAQFAGLDPLRWTRDPSIRPFGTLGNPNQLAHYLSVAAGVCLGLTVFARSVTGRIAAGIATVLFVAVSGLTGARAGLLGLGAALAVALIVLWRLRSGSWTLALPVAVAGLVISVVALLSPTGQRLIQGPLADRVALYETAARAVAARPLLGYGPDQFAIAFTQNRSADTAALFADDERHIWAHDFVLQAFATTGAVGGFALLALLVLGTLSMWRALAIEPLVAAPLLLGWTAYWSEALLTVPSVTVDWFPWLALGIAGAITRKAPSEIHRRPLAPIARGAVLAAAVAGSLTGFAALRANHDAGSARGDLLLGLPEPAVAAAASAVARDPGRADYWNWLGVANEAAGRWAEATAAYSEAVRRSDYTAIYWANLARARARLGMTVQSRDAYSRALEIDPLNPIVRRSLADTSFLLADCDQALEQIVAAYEISKGDARYATELERAAVCAMELAASRNVLMRALEVGETSSLHAALARILFRLGDLDAARAHAQRAVELNGQNGTAREILDATGPGG
jgi:O-antigen ligase/Tfp pilus assembly protein PilF